ncbi:PRC-barrel domain-containing protein [Arthrobacter sp. H20]|uniref:PRC-barrel domain-containing protein n=1 Tax=Arthrobacter sp. H20 TaxID=1267981 RepID=UPI00047A4925|nr:PRC-barrel domain-containing protein [Arthrobacter sp. H20]
MAQSDISALQEATAWDADGEKLGEVSQVHLDARTGEPAWLTVPLGLFNTREHFIPFDGARLEGGDLHVAYSKDKIIDAPDLGADSELTDEQTASLREYYNL